MRLSTLSQLQICDKRQLSIMT